MVELETSPAAELERRLLEAFLRHPEASSTGMRRGMDTRELLYYENWLRRMRQRGETMPTLMEATWDKWFEEHDAQGREQGLSQGREQGLAEGTMRTLRRLAVARFGARTVWTRWAIGCWLARPLMNCWSVFGPLVAEQASSLSANPRS